MDDRTPAYIQSDLSVHHEIRTGEKTCTWISNSTPSQRTEPACGYTSVNEIAVAGSGLISPTRAPRFSGDPGVDWNKIMTAYNYVDALNGTGAFAGVQSKVDAHHAHRATACLQLYQQPRTIRLSIRFTF